MYRFDIGVMQKQPGFLKTSAGWRINCPVHNSADADLALGVGERGVLLYKCFGDCEWQDIKAALLKLGVIVGDSKKKHGSGAWTDAERAAFIKKTWGDSTAINGTRAELYLRGRGLALKDWPLHLRWHEDKKWMVAKIALGNKGVGLHRTHIVSKERRTFGDFRGGAVRLCALEGDLLAIAEGIETALAYRQISGLPTWAALSTSGLIGFKIPESVKRILIAADFDGAGLKAAETLEKRAKKEGVSAEIVLPGGNPPYYRRDWLDLLKEKS